MFNNYPLNHLLFPLGCPTELIFSKPCFRLGGQPPPPPLVSCLDPSDSFLNSLGFTHVHENDSSKHKSDHICPLVKFLQWSPTAMGIEPRISSPSFRSLASLHFVSPAPTNHSCPCYTAILTSPKQVRTSYDSDQKAPFSLLHLANSYSSFKTELDSQLMGSFLLP